MDGSNGLNAGRVVPGARKVTVCGSALLDVQSTVSPTLTQTCLGRNAIAVTAISGVSAPTRTCHVTGAAVAAKAFDPRPTGTMRAQRDTTDRTSRRTRRLPGMGHSSPRTPGRGRGRLGV